MSCVHENDDAVCVLLCTPKVDEICNQNTEKCLMKEPVKSDLLYKNHQALKSALQSHNVQLIDISSYLTSPDPLQLANAVFVRDPIIVTQKGVVIGNFKESIRIKEVEYLETFLQSQSIPIIGRIVGEGFLEGGDFVPLGKDMVLIACGNRTNMKGIEQCLQQDVFGTRYVAVVDYPEDELMKTIHLDCYLGIVDYQHALLWEDIYTDHIHVNVHIFERAVGEGYVCMNTVPLKQFLEQQGYVVHSIPTSSQEHYGCNVLDIGHMVLCQDQYVHELLQSLNIPCMFVHFEEIHKMFGGIRCASQVIYRKQKII